METNKIPLQDETQIEKGSIELNHEDSNERSLERQSLSQTSPFTMERSPYSNKLEHVIKMKSI